MSEVKLDANGLIANNVISSEIETQTLKLGEGVLSEDPSGSLAWNGENFLTNSNKGYSHFVGEQWISFDGTIPLGGIPFDGRSVERSLYPDLVKWIQDNNRAISKSDYQTRLSNNYSNVPYYVLETDTITMPIYRGYLYFNDNKTAGSYIKQGLPNISGFINEAYGGYGSWGGSGAFSIVNGSNVSTRGGGGGNVNDKDITFNASKSNSIYGASSDVTPHTTCILIGVYAYNTISNQSNIDLETFRQTMAAGLGEGIIPCFPISTTVPPYTNKLCVQDASKDNAPNNGVILSTYTNANYNGQLFIGDNASQGLWVRGVSNATQGAWKPVLHLEKSASSGNWYRKYSDGLIIQSGTIATTAGDRDTSTITLPTAFTSTNYYANVMLENVDMNGGGGMWTVKSKTTTSFIIHNGQDTTGTFRWFAIGY